MARQGALERIGITQEFGFEDHKGITVMLIPLSARSPLKNYVATTQPLKVTSYLEHPIPEFSYSPAFNVDRIPAADCTSGPERAALKPFCREFGTLIEFIHIYTVTICQTDN